MWQEEATFPVTCPYCGAELDGTHRGNKLIIPDHPDPEDECEEDCEGSGKEAS